MKVSSKQYAQSLYQALEQTPQNHWENIFNNFVVLLAKNHLLSQAPKIFIEFKKYYNDQKGIIEFQVKTSVPLNSEQRQSLTQRLKEITGQKIELIESLDRALIGGLVLQTADLSIDGSLKNNLQDLKKEISLDINYLSET